MNNDNEEIAPRNKSLFPLTPDDIVDNALANLDERQVKDVTRKVADEVVRIAVEKRKAEYRNSAAQDEMSNLINNANLLDERVGDYKINSTFETASGTTNVEIRKSKTVPLQYLAAGAGLIVAILVLLFLVLRT